MMDAPEQFVFPAEFEPHDSIWLSWPTYENKQGLPTEPLLMEILSATAGHVAIDLLAQDEAEIVDIQRRFKEKGVPSEHVRFHPVPHRDIWMRDMGPIFLRGNRGGLKIVDHGFNMWGYEDEASDASRLEGGVARLIAERLGLEMLSSSLITEGGNHEFNGRGTMLAVKAVERQRNPDWELSAIEEELVRTHGQEKLIWLEQGVAEDELPFRGKLPGDVFAVITTGGHIDEFARFVDAKTILLAEVTADERDQDPIAAISFERLEVNRKVLAGATDQEGEPFRILRMPVPDSMFETMKAGDGVFDYLQRLTYDDGTVIRPDDTIRVVAATSYLNYVVTNGLVLMPSYWKEGLSESIREKDERAREVLTEVFVGRKIVALDPMPVNLGGGGLHCITQQQPADA